MLTRRALLAASVVAPGVPRSDVLRFRLIREGSKIGAHVLHFLPRPEGMRVTIAVDIAVRFGPFVLYRYRLRGSETWRNGRCVGAASRTEDDGTPLFMRAERDASGFWVTGTHTPRYRAPPTALVASHWNQAELRGPWINLENGRLLHPHVTPLGVHPALLADGAQVPARSYSITGPATMRLWYTLGGVWTGLLFTASDGSLVRYERVT
ncbi:MAG: DUF6134 family protein [Acetobacteraceae bacterium]